MRVRRLTLCADKLQTTIIWNTSFDLLSTYQDIMIFVQF
jgi:hypothetical protein